MSHAAIIFDCDGTLVDSMPAHYEAWLVMLERYQLKLEEERYYALGGWPTLQVAELVIREAGHTDLDPAQVAREKEEYFEQNLTHKVDLIEPVIKVARQYRGEIPLGVATGGVRSIVQPMLERAGILDWFETLVTADDVAHPKPAPDIYLAAARRLNVDPTRCLVYEDAEPGIESAKAAGMEVVDVRTLHTPRRVTL